MSTLRLAFRCDPPLDWPRLRDILGRLAERLAGRPLALAQVHREALIDPNEGRPSLFDARWEAEGARLAERISAGEGNPRDGWGYNQAFSLQVERPGGEVALRYSGGSADPLVSSLDLELLGADFALFQEVRAFWRAELGGAAADRSARPYPALLSLHALAASDPASARALVAEVLAGGQPGESGWAQVLQWKYRLEGGDPELLGRRLRESPSDASAWRLALAAPPPGWGAGQVRAILARLCPFDPSLLAGTAAEALAPAWMAHPGWLGDIPAEWAERVAAARAEDPLWMRLEDGMGEAERVVPHYPLLRALLPELREAEEVGGALDAPDAERRLRPLWQARFVGGALPLVAARWEASRREAGEWDLPWAEQQARPMREQATWLWLWGPEPGDVLVVADWKRRRAGALLSGGWAARVSGSSAFQGRVDEALRELTPYRLVPVPASRLGEDRGIPSFELAPGEDPWAAVAAALAEAGGVPAPLLALIAAKAADEGELRWLGQELLREQHAARGSAREHARAWIRAYLLRAARGLLGGNEPNARSDLAHARRQAASYAAMREDA